ncbi:DNA repair protein RecN [Alkalicella caledoniensis]|uniref:DNA repair protein RecN n=1 Tax=Alkalicella caledoniensis TaxID=2731377 RepID=A0A7G9WBV6_ALKCA|nr:DNA repair protein RecN [Alkalicella caledoniensis]QNO16168.1 DNA repair protein RecN [Alkalicella caledoniensis]
MLDRISIENFALIDSLELDFREGLTILSGETGAGKSIIIDALTLLTGGRSSTEYIRSGFDKSTITGIFSVSNAKGKEITQQYDIEVEDQLIVTKEIYLNGKSITKVNNKLVTVNLLKELTKDMVDIHGQHEHHSLLDPQKHLDILDMFGGLEIRKILDEYSELFNERKNIKNDLDKLYSSVENRERKMDLLKYEIDEISKGNLKIDEDEELLNQRKKMMSAEKLYNASTKGYEKLYQGEENPSVIEQIGEIISDLQAISKFDDKITPMLGLLESALYQVEEVSRELLNYSHSLDLDPEALSSIEMRIDEINRLKRKYGADIEDILYYHEIKVRELEDLVNSEQLFVELKGKLSKTEEKMKAVGQKLTSTRKSTGELMATQITKQLADLSMEKTIFQIFFKENTWEFFEHGLDDVEFLISPNPGEPLKPLAKIASGGEMSRIMLAMKNILADIDNIKTLVFDEVDTGIGGRTAQKVAEKLANVSKGRQVLCVSHLPQICVMANTHFKIMKKETQGRTVSFIEALDEKEKIIEIARMISGAEVTQATINHAREMLSLAQNFKS